MYLIDSHILLWWSNDSRRFSADIREMLYNTQNAIYYSVVAPWELSIKHAKKKLALPERFFELLPKLGFDCLPVEEKHVNALRTLPILHGDPFDRMLAAQAKAEKMTLITADKKLAAYPIKTLLVKL